MGEGEELGDIFGLAAGDDAAQDVLEPVHARAACIPLRVLQGQGSVRAPQV